MRPPRREERRTDETKQVWYYPYAHSIPQIAKQYAWLERELAETDRTKTPWVVTAAHRPMYCSPNDDWDECHQAAVGPWHRHSFIRKGVLGKWGFEELLYRYGVDVYFGAHEHSYERFFPVYNKRFVAGPDAYVDPPAPVHITVGAGGSREGQDPWRKEGFPYSAVRLNVYGFGLLTVGNATHLHWEQLDADTGEVVDRVDLVRRDGRHGPFDPADLPEYGAAAAARDAGDGADGLVRS